MNRASMFLSLALAAAVAACGGQAQMIPGTDIRDTPQNDDQTVLACRVRPGGEAP